MKKNHSKKIHQKIYRIKGCSNTRKKRASRKYLGGTSFAYTGQPVHTQSNPYLAYTGGQTNNKNSNAYPNTGPPRAMNGTIFNSQSGGTCSACSIAQPLNIMNGGNCGPQCNMGFNVGGKKRRSMSGGNHGIRYPNGLVGYKWTPHISDWPGVGNIPGNNNYYPVNHYINDISRQMKSLGANPPFLKGGSRKRKKRTQKGGVLSNFMGQDLINLGRQFQYGVGNAYNSISGYASPVNPLPWKDQLLPNKATSINSKVL